VKPLLILRPEPGATITAERAAALGLTPVVRPMFAIVRRAWDAPDPAQFDSLVLTSANAVREAGDALPPYRQLPLFVVGDSTARAAIAAGLIDPVVDTKNAAQLLNTLAQQGYRRPLHLTGEDRTPYPDLALSITTRIVYASEEIPVTLPDPPFVALIHSARAARRFADLCTDTALIDVVTISPDVAAILGPNWRSIHTARDPRDEAMLELAVRLCKEDAVPTTGNA